MATIPAAGYISNAARTLSQVQTALEDIVASLRQMPGAAQAEIVSTISAGSITPPGSAGVILVDTEAAAATDDLTNVVTTNYPDGSMIVLRNANIARVVTAKQLAGGAGQLNLDRSADYVMDDEKKWVLLQRRGADWYEVFRGPIRLTGFTVAKSSAFTVQKEDLGKVMVCTGTFTASLTAVAGVGNGFVSIIRNVGTGIVTIDPSGSELVNGATTLQVWPGWSYALVCDGSAWYAIGSTGPVSAENPIINGSMEIWQRGTAFTSIANASYSADRWEWGQVGAGVVNVNRSTSVPAVAASGIFFNYSYEVDVTTADATIAAGDLYVVSHKIEGGNWRHFAQRDMTLSFWVLSTKTGTHCVAFRNAAVADRSYIGTYTVNATNTWEWKSITVPASPSAGSWNYTTSIGLMITFGLAVGSTYQTTAGAWQVGDFYGSSAQVNCLDSTSNFFRLTGVKLEVGSNATPLDVYSYDTELVRCQRYYQKSFLTSTTPAQNTGNNTAEVSFPQPVAASTAFANITIPLLPMRAAPTVTLFNPNAANAQIRNRATSTDCSASTTTNVTEKGFTLSATSPAATSVGQQLVVHWTASAEM